MKGAVLSAVLPVLRDGGNNGVPEERSRLEPEDFWLLDACDIEESTSSGISRG